MIATYKPSNSGSLLRHFNSATVDVLNNFESQGDLIVSGDFNIDMLNPCNVESVFIEVMKTLAILVYVFYRVFRDTFLGLIYLLKFIYL